MDTVEAGAGVYVAPKDLPALCQRLDYGPFKALLMITATDAGGVPAGSDMRSWVGLTCTETFIGDALDGSVVTTIAFHADVALTKRMYEAQRTPGNLEAGTLTDVHGVGVEAFRYLSNDTPNAKVLNLTARRSNATVAVRVVLHPAKNATTGKVSAFFTSMETYVGKELTALQGAAAR